MRNIVIILLGTLLVAVVLAPVKGQNQTYTLYRQFDTGANLLAWSPDGQLLTSTDPAGQLQVWDVQSGQLIKLLANKSIERVEAAVWQPDGEQLASITEKQVTVWDTKSWSISFEFGCGIDEDFSPDSKYLVCLNKYSVLLLNTLTGTLERELINAGTLLTKIAWKPDGQQLAFSADDAGLIIFDLEDDTQALQLGLVDGVVQRGSIKDIGWVIDSQLYAISDSQVLNLWHLPTYQSFTLRVEHLPADAIAFSHRGQWLATNHVTVGSCADPCTPPAPEADYVVEIREVLTLAIVATLTHDGDVFALAWSPNDMLLATATSAAIYVWERVN